MFCALEVTCLYRVNNKYLNPYCSSLKSVYEVCKCEKIFVITLELRVSNLNDVVGEQG